MGCSMIWWLRLHAFIFHSPSGWILHVGGMDETVYSPRREEKIMCPLQLRSASVQQEGTAAATSSSPHWPSQGRGRASPQDLPQPRGWRGCPPRPSLPTHLLSPASPSPAPHPQLTAFQPSAPSSVQPAGILLRYWRKNQLHECVPSYPTELLGSMTVTPPLPICFPSPQGGSFSWYFL